ncbi:DNA alkylation repair protein [bacterium]|nr:DNA alkylation repair protein [bacterium]
MNKIDKIKNDLKKVSSKKDAQILQRFFKIKKGEYGEGDVFLGIRIPKQREIVKKYLDLDLKSLEILLKINIHEYRLTALLILVKKFELATKNNDQKLRTEFFKFYLKNTKYINNWDLVDLTAPKIIGAYLFKNQAEKKILIKLAKSKNLWERRIAIITTFHFIYQGKYRETLKISRILLNDEHDLIHKAVGWMLREVGKKIDQKIEEQFLQKYYQKMPRTMLRYAIEKFSEKKRQYYLKK